MHQLRVFFRLAKGIDAALFCERDKGRQKGATDVLDKGEVFGPVARTVVIQKDTADATGAVAVGDVEIFVCPFF